MTKKLKFIFVGRLEEEKGFHLILDMCTVISTMGNIAMQLDVFGDGALKDHLLELEKKTDFIIYHGYQPLEKVKNIRKNCHYTLIPSLFLETFGLTALDSLSLGVPIIAPCRGGLAQFSSDTYMIETATDLLEIVQAKITHFDKTSWEEESRTAMEVASRYSKQQRLDRFRELSGLEPGSRILLVSDFIIDIGGIEHYLLDISLLLENAGYEVRLIGCDDEYIVKNRFSQLGKTIRNREGDALFAKTIEEFSPDMVRWHSIQRRRGPLVLRRARHVRAKHWIMYHDFGLFHPYPSRVYSAQQITDAVGFFQYMKQGYKERILHIPLHVAKRCSRILLMSHLMYMIDLHLVPSVFMEELVESHYRKKISVTTLSHF